MLKEWGLDAIRAYNHTWRGPAPGGWPIGGRTEFDVPEAMIASMATVPLPEAAGSTPGEAQALRDALFFEDDIEVQMHAYRGRVRARISAQIYNRHQRHRTGSGEAVAKAAVGVPQPPVNPFRSSPVLRV